MKKENKFLDATIAIVSGILTELIYSELSTSYWEKQIVDGVETFVEISKYPIGIKIVVIVLLFIVIWLILAMIIPRLEYKIRTLSNRHRPTYNTKEIIETFNNTKKTIQQIAFSYNNNFSKIPFDMLFSDDIANCINELYAIFCSNGGKQKKTVESVFRGAESINTKGKYISRYEFKTLIITIENLFNECMKKGNDYNSIHDETLKIDTENLQKKIDELKNF